MVVLVNLKTQPHDPGGRSLPLPDGVKATAEYGGPGNCYRYLLRWEWNALRPTLAVGMMNPSTASHVGGDATVAWVHRWARLKGFGTLLVVNAAAYRATDQARLAEIADPVGPDNPAWIAYAGSVANAFILGYGVPKVRAARAYGPEMARLLHANGVKLHVWKLTNEGHPSHPLYLPGTVDAMPWTPPAGVQR